MLSPLSNSSQLIFSIYKIGLIVCQPPASWGRLRSNEIEYVTELGKLQNALTVLTVTEIMTASTRHLEKKPPSLTMCLPAVSEPGSHPLPHKFRWKRARLSLTEICYHSIESEVHGKSKKQNRYFKRHLFKLVSTVMQGEREPCHPVMQQNPQSLKHLVYTLLAELQVPADGSGWSGKAKSRTWVFHQWSDLIWKFLQTPLSRKNTA